MAGMMQSLGIPGTRKYAELSIVFGCVLGHYPTYFSGASPRSWPADKTEEFSFLGPFQVQVPCFPGK